MCPTPRPPNNAQSWLRPPPLPLTGKAATPSSSQVARLRKNHSTCLLAISPDDVREAVVAVWSMTILEGLLTSFPPLPSLEWLTALYFLFGRHIATRVQSFIWLFYLPCIIIWPKYHICSCKFFQAVISVLLIATELQCLPVACQEWRNRTIWAIFIPGKTFEHLLNFN